MENTVVQFIVENIFLFLPLGITGIIITTLLYVTGKKENKPEPEDVTSDDITKFHISINVYSFIYLVIWTTIFIIGILSDFLIPTITGGILALIPFLLMMGIKQKTKNPKVP
jgi:hypothetical protein